MNTVLRGSVVRGKGKGHLHGMPTANLAVEAGTVLPKEGVYAARVFLRGEEYRGLTNVGRRPSDDNMPHITVETYILDFSGDIYGEELTLELVHYIRGVRRFAGGLDELRQQLEKDEEELRRVLPPRRKKNRLPNFDYSSQGAYFLTICTKDRKALFWEESVGASIARPDDVPLSEYGKIVKECLCAIPEHYPALSMDHYVIMPDHVHLLLRICTTGEGRAMLAPTISRVIRQFKGAVTKRLGFSPWQKLYYDHVIRDDEDYLQKWNYIEGNPMKEKREA